MYNCEILSTDGFSEQDYSDSSSISSGRRAQRRLLQEHKRADSGFHVLKRRVLDKKNNYVNVNVEIYSTAICAGVSIRHAIYGSRYPDFKVGSKYEGLFFKVCDVSGRVRGKDGTSMFYYDSPEQYERHTGTEVNPDIKEKWMEKYRIAQKLRE